MEKQANKSQRFNRHVITSCNNEGIYVNIQCFTLTLPNSTKPKLANKLYQKKVTGPAATDVYVWWRHTFIILFFLLTQK